MCTKRWRLADGHPRYSKTSVEMQYANLEAMRLACLGAQPLTRLVDRVSRSDEQAVPQWLTGCLETSRYVRS